MTFLLLACDSKSCWLNSLRKRCLSKIETGAEDDAIRVNESRLPTPNLSDCLSPSNGYVGRLGVEVARLGVGHYGGLGGDMGVGEEGPRLGVGLDA
ncbi:hypothetical protein PIB30_085816 [Stylosanthes scabra]|uniref:Uncharacterized protein n=1 Tax=Stylosanthes scabra TaxID=79078 RepID=A0ABU6RT49_9FABA|nr:hypothetical protein [Stylosanthes scabra]